MLQRDGGIARQTIGVGGTYFRQRFVGDRDDLLGQIQVCPVPVGAVEAQEGQRDAAFVHLWQTVVDIVQVHVPGQYVAAQGVGAAGCVGSRRKLRMRLEQIPHFRNVTVRM